MSSPTDKLAHRAKTMATSARQKANVAEEELKVANDELADAIQHKQPGKVKRAHQRTQIAEKAVGEAAQDMEAVEVLLDSVGGSTTGAENSATGSAPGTDRPSPPGK